MKNELFKRYTEKKLPICGYIYIFLIFMLWMLYFIDINYFRFYLMENKILYEKYHNGCSRVMR